MPSAPDFALDHGSPNRKTARSAASTIAILSFGLVANLVPLMTFAACLPEIAADWSFSGGQAGWIGGIYFAGYAAAVPILASATDRVDGRPLYAASAALAAVAALAFATWADGFALALVLRFIGGIALAGVHMPGLKLLMDRVEGPAQARGAAIYTSSYAAGSAGSFLIAGAVDAAFGWRATFVAAGIAPLLTIAVVALLPPRPTQEKNSARLMEFRTLLRDRALMAYVIGFAGNTWEVFAVRVWFVACLDWTLSLPGNAMALPPLAVVSGLASLAGVPVSLVMAEVASRHGRRRVITAICLVSVLVCVTLAATAGGSTGVVLTLLVLVQITSFADVGAMAGGLVAAADPARRGAALAIYALTGFTTGFLSPLVIGLTLDAFGGVRSVAGWRAAFLITALGSAAAAWAVRRAHD
jgi:MFS family permease